MGKPNNGRFFLRYSLGRNGYEFIKEEFGAEDDPYGNGMLIYKKH